MTFLSTALLAGGSIIDLDGTILVQLGLFFVAYLILYTLVFKPMIALFAAREEAIDGAKEEARRLVAEADGLDADFQAKLDAVRAEAGSQRDALRKEGAQREAQILAEARAATDAELEAAEKKLDAEAARLRKELDAKIPELASEIASRLLARKVV
ncbi:MAG: ATP synthase F0 subunit B [Myxococcales bacterium]|nr:ATP synthase F0 subunit B [Myxococcales bacterium]